MRAFVLVLSLSFCWRLRTAVLAAGVLGGRDVQLRRGFPPLRYHPRGSALAAPSSYGRTLRFFCLGRLCWYGAKMAPTATVPLASVRGRRAWAGGGAGRWAGRLLLRVRWCGVLY